MPKLTSIIENSVSLKANAFGEPPDFIGVTNRCDGCMDFHTRALIKLQELEEALGIAFYVSVGLGDAGL